MAMSISIIANFLHQNHHTFSRKFSPSTRVQWWSKQPLVFAMTEMAENSISIFKTIKQSIIYLYCDNQLFPFHCQKSKTFTIHLHISFTFSDNSGYDTWADTLTVSVMECSRSRAIYRENYRSTCSNLAWSTTIFSVTIEILCPESNIDEIIAG
jgi:hypothetical protein